MSLISPQVEQHYRNPCGADAVLTGDNVVSGRAGRLATGAVLELRLQIQGSTIEAASFEAFGCPATVACGSWLAAWLPGRELAEAAALTGLEVARQLALPPLKTGVALVAEDALKAALQAWQND
ncbi:hypothetical protein CAI21_05720 [Alkalilimnicola ehrlichii]|uniref:NIF system FeS cluster assembly NifU N-terminal domain-containing protein n=1 Tax=Alkalilimnicola ehrlichii TaxID=351052 RepID=A0A3E0WYM8_9GAMM|nr:iron-sulfur cluster assembly scaffold protein [Alkalilimnicola ehrlichii]RFA30543.1 hypothetical protein CAI21_05720 [Alkalilimnicola ehrlichii]RFA38092.1 hypothetical protein CAL65_07095 [Alkalilimnicola ehrlichii]